MPSLLDTLREVRFFAQHANLSNSELLHHLADDPTLDQAGEIPETEKDLESHSYLPAFLSADPEKFLDIDLEADVCNGNEAYVQVLQDLARASGGHFNPAQITETWDSDEGPVTVSFVNTGRRTTFHPEVFDDWLDGSPFAAAKIEMARVTDEQFHFCAGPGEEWMGQNAIYIRLTPAQRKILEERLGWIFSDRD